MPVGRLLGEIEQAAEQHGIEGFTLVGGEPFAQAPGAAALAEGVQTGGLSVIVFTGYTLEELRAIRDGGVDELLRHTDVLVDGPYIEELPETRRRWVGSANQRVHFLTDRYRPDDPCWQLPNSLEIRLRGSELSVSGFPAPRASELWRQVRPVSRWTRTEAK